MTTFYDRLSKGAAMEHGETRMVTDIDYGTVLVLYTGGTIGMKHNAESVYVTEREYLHKWLKNMPFFHDEVYAVQEATQNRLSPVVKGFRYSPLYMPVVGGSHTKYLCYVIHEYQPVIDSSNMDFDGMLQIALDIKKYYRKFDGFVILHGTDTMSYTAAALSFILENLGKPVVLTGSQIPIYETRSDGRDNFSGALILAAGYSIPEVCVYFENKLFRGNRCRKVSADDLNAFDSPNFPPIAKVEICCTVYWDLIERSSTVKPFTVHTLLSPNVAILRIFPNISPSIVRVFLQPPIEGVVMQCYGAGNFPDENLELIDVLEKAAKRGVIIVNTTQCRRGAVNVSYAGAQSLLKAGIVPGYDMTSEAALAKLSYALTKPWTLEEKKSFISCNAHGELTAKNLKRSVKHKSMSEVLNALGLLELFDQSEEGQNEMKEALIVPLVCLAIRKGDIQLLDDIVQTYPGILMRTDHNNRTILHAAIDQGSYETVCYLVQHGSPIHPRDKSNHSALLEAVYCKRYDVIEFFMSAGAHLNMHPEKVAIELNQAVAAGDLSLVTAFWNAGAKLNVWDYHGVTPLIVAVMNSNIEIIKYLCKRGANPLIETRGGKSCLTLTTDQKIIKILQDTVEAQRWKKIKCRVVDGEGMTSASIVGLVVDQRSRPITLTPCSPRLSRRTNVQNPPTTLQSPTESDLSQSTPDEINQSKPAQSGADQSNGQSKTNSTETDSSAISTNHSE